MNSIRNLIVTALLLTISIGAYASEHGNQWKLITAKSSISFVSIKKGSIGEIHTFGDFSGDLVHGKAEVSIKPDSVDTGIGIRNDRVREFLFETAIYPVIEISSDVSSAIKMMGTAGFASVEIPASLKLHGVTREISLNVLITRNGEDWLTVASTKPVMIKAGDFNMDTGVLKLAELVGGISIASAVPVNFVLSFQK